MDIGRRNFITSKQYMTFLISAQVGVGAITLPNRLAVSVGHDGWIAVIFGGIISASLSTLSVKLMERYKDKNLFEINSLSYGKFFGTALNLLVILYSFLKCSITLGFFVQTVHTTALKLTPAIILAAVLAAPAIYLSWYGLKPMCRFASVIFVIIFLEFFLFTLRFGEFKTVFLMPVGIFKIPKMARAIFSTSYTFLSSSILTIIYTEITDKKNALKYSLTSNVITTLFILISTAFTIGLFGENMLKHIIFPLYEVATTYNVPVLERIDLWFLSIWFPALSMSFGLYFFIIYYSIGKVFKKTNSSASKSSPNKAKKSIFNMNTVSLLVLSIFIVLFSIIPNNFSDVRKYIIILDYIGNPLIFGPLIFNYILSFFKKPALH